MIGRSSCSASAAPGSSPGSRVGHLVLVHDGLRALLVVVDDLGVGDLVVVGARRTGAPAAGAGRLLRLRVLRTAAA